MMVLPWHGHGINNASFSISVMGNALIIYDGRDGFLGLAPSTNRRYCKTDANAWHFFNLFPKFASKYDSNHQ